MLRDLWRLAWGPYLRARGLNDYWQALETFDRLSELERRDQLGRRLLGQLQYFGNRADALPEWREAARIGEVDELWRVWPELPILTRSDLQTRFHPDRLRKVGGAKGVVSSTGGSTGEPTPYLHDRNMRLAAWAATLYYRWNIGWRPWIPLIVVWGSERDIGKQRTLRGRAKGYLQLQHLVDGYNLTEHTAHEVRRLVDRYHPVVVHGFSSMLDFVAQTLLEDNAIPPRGQVLAAWNGGEMLYDEQSRRFERVFGVPILNYYGGRELSAMAYQQSRSEPLRVLRPLLYVEIVDDKGRPVAPGEEGRLIWTSTACRGTPFLRYDVGDLGVFGEQDHDAAGIARLQRLLGRSAGLITLEDGTRLNCIFWNHLLKEFEAVKQFQIVVRRDHTVRVRLKGSGFSEQEDSRLRAILTPLFGSAAVVEWVDAIPLTREGKLEPVVRE